LAEELVYDQVQRRRSRVSNEKKTNHSVRGVFRLQDVIRENERERRINRELHFAPYRAPHISCPPSQTAKAAQ
jgi:hypothetical protein